MIFTEEMRQYGASPILGTGFPMMRSARSGDRWTWLLLIVVAWGAHVHGANVAYEGFDSPSVVNLILSNAGHVPTPLTAAQVEGGSLVVGSYDVFVISRATTFEGISTSYAQAITNYVAAGGNIITEYAGVAPFFSQYASDIRPPTNSNPQLAIFDGAVHAGWGHETDTPIDLLDNAHPISEGLSDPVVDAEGTEFFYWIESTDVNLHFLGQFTGNGDFGFPLGQQLDCLAVGCLNDSTFVFATWDWNDTLAVGSISAQFLANAVNFAISGDCDNDGVPNDCEGGIDCNINGSSDACDIGTGASLDCDLNGILDECESPDCPAELVLFDINNGGVLSTGGPYAITASTGQHGGIDVLTSADYELRDGFWHTLAGACGECRLYGDVVPGHCLVDVDDLLCVLDAFVGAFVAPCSIPAADIEPCGGDADVDSDDLLAILAAFTGFNFCPDPCPM